MFISWIVISILIGIGVVGGAVGAGFALYRGTLDQGDGPQRATRIAVLAAACLTAWAACSTLLAAGGAYVPLVPPWQLITMVAELIALLSVARIPVVRRALAGPGAPRRLLWPQFVRIIGVAFIVGMFAGILPPLFALPAGLGDMAVGVAVLRADRLAATAPHRRVLVGVNVLGIVDLVTATAVGALAGFGFIHVSPDVSAIGRPPFALLLTVGVPLFLACHILSLRRLGRAPRSAPGLSAVGTTASAGRTPM